MSSLVPTSFSAELYKNMSVSQLSTSSFKISDETICFSYLFHVILHSAPLGKASIPHAGMIKLCFFV